MTIQEIVEKHYNEMFSEVLEDIGDEMFDIVVEVKTLGGQTVRMSWADRDKRLKEWND